MLRQLCATLACVAALALVCQQAAALDNGLGKKPSMGYNSCQ